MEKRGRRNVEAHNMYGVIGMVRKLFTWQSFFWPLFAAGCLAALFVTLNHGPIMKDALEYDTIAKSILQGHYDLGGKPTMLREPLYPLMRSVVNIITTELTVILWVQVALLMATIWFVAKATGEMDRRLELPTAWMSAFAYGFAVYASRHLTELLTAFLLAFAGWAYMKLLRADDTNGRSLCWAGALGTAAGLVGLTRGIYQFFGALMAAILMFALVKKTLRHRLAVAGVVFITSATVMLPWLVRNALSFQVYAITQRAGVVLYVRALNAEQSWSALSASVGSALFGQASMKRWYPEIEPIITQHQRKVWQAYEELVEQGLSDQAVDAALLKVAKRIIFSSPETFLRYLAWTPVEEWRLMSLPSPGTPDFSIEGMYIAEAASGALTIRQVVTLLVVHFIDWMWVLLTLYGLVYGFKHYRRTFIPGFIVLYTLLLHAPVDAVIRYGVPITPWRMAIVAMLGAAIVIRMHGRIATMTNAR